MKKDLTRKQQKKALKLMMFLKKKRCCRIKGRACADGRSQRLYTKKEDAASPTAALESIMLTSVIDAMERRDVATVDIVGAFLRTDCDEDVWLMLDGALAELMVDVAPEIYSKYVTIGRKNKPVLYVKLKKALYGCLKSALLFYKKLSNDLINMGFTLNPYDPCVANKTINGKQMTIVWHVDDLKISHVDPEEVTKMCNKLKELYGEIVVHRGKVHDYLGMQLTFKDDGKLDVNMVPYVNETSKMFPEELNGIVRTPAADCLLNVNPNGIKLDTKKTVPHSSCT